MSTIGTTLMASLVILVLLVLYAIGIYNRLVRLRNRFKNGFAQIDVQLQRRYDLIPNLVESAQAYLQHERETLRQVMEARNQAISASRMAASRPEDSAAIRGLSAAEGRLSQALANFQALNENYPELKADATIRQLMEELTSTENKVGFARQAYNDAVMQYHSYREQFPNNVVAGFFGFKETSYFEVEQPKVRQAVQVRFG